ncbi:unnamed protein product [Ilex paraguariensis]|uniref:Glutamine amidotransferase domain-containing protein n=1 Tax=Ilex paraguariensis TaxID=185542 RepID=A0ABC8SKL8_9AQUA
MEPRAVKSNLVLILDYGSQYTHLITRRIRSLSVFSLCISGTSSLKSITDLDPTVIILSGGPHSVHAANAPCFPTGFVEYVESKGVYVLGICYGLQLIVERLGGEVRVGEEQEYGRMEIEVEKSCGLFANKEVGARQVVWMSHGDEAKKLPDGFEVVARSQQGSVAALENRARRFYGLQYHPELMEAPGAWKIAWAVLRRKVIKLTAGRGHWLGSARALTILGKGPWAPAGLPPSLFFSP